MAIASPACNKAGKTEAGCRRCSRDLSLLDEIVGTAASGGTAYALRWHECAARSSGAS